MQINSATGKMFDNDVIFRYKFIRENKTTEIKYI